MSDAKLILLAEDRGRPRVGRHVYVIGNTSWLYCGDDDQAAREKELIRLRKRSSETVELGIITEVLPAEWRLVERARIVIETPGDDH